MPTLFDFLPLDVINYEIKPYIGNDYFARLTINSILPPIDRQGSPLRPDAAKQFALSLNVAKLKRLIDAFTRVNNPLDQSENIVLIFDYLLENPLILQHNRNFREVALRQAKTFADTDCDQYALLQETAKANLLSKAKLLLEFMEITPFLYAINTSIGSEKWTAVCDAGLCVVVDNSRELALAEKARRSTPHWRTVYNHCYYDDDGENEYGYYDSNEKWVCLRNEYEEQEVQVSRRGTVKEADGWERVVSRKRW